MKKQYTYIPTNVISKHYTVTAKGSNTKIVLKMFSNDILEVQRKIEAITRVASIEDTWEIYLEDNSL